MIYHIVGMSQNRVIGKDNALPWHFSADLKHFKALTTGQTVIMGRKTFESIGRPLPNRANFVLSRAGFQTEGVCCFSSIENALQEVKSEHAFIIGGASIYEQSFDMIDGIYLTFIHKDYEGDAYYPEIPRKFERETKPRKVLQEDPLVEVYFYQNMEK